MVLARGHGIQRPGFRRSRHSEAAHGRRRIRRLILGFALVAPLIAVAIWKTTPLGAVGVVFVSHMLLLYPTLRANSQWFGEVVTRFETSHKEVWLTIDDGPDPVDTPAMIDLLKQHGARATFFVKGASVAEHPDLARTIVSSGNRIGNHSWSHPSGSFWCFGPGAIAAEIDRGQEIVAAVTGSRPRRFRAPVGMKNPFVHPLLSRRGLRLIGWSARGFDGVGFDPESAVSRILKDVTPGTVILLHEGRTGTDGRRVNLECLALLLAKLDSQGYRCVIPADDQLLAGRRKTKR